ncbi:MAG: hypothetical protein B6229_07305 [Spirochaetaceae bacterium 4572_7]|nr:MAG: hypothetical protein B6229_07305 [Spirochaetaceae bacterium 4572_7]
MTSESAHPHVNWLKHVKTARAKSKIRNWLNTHHKSVSIDKNVVIKNSPNKIKIENEIEHFATYDDRENAIEHQEVHNTEKNSIIIGDESNMLVSFANCCHPVIGDEIVGFVSRGRGVIVHRKDCSNLPGINEFKEREISISWEAEQKNNVRKCRITAKRVSGIFSEIENALKKYNSHLISGVLDDNDRGCLEGNFIIELTNRDDFKKILKSLRTIPTITFVQELK